MDIQRVNYIIERAILFLQADEIESLHEFTVLTPKQMRKRTGMRVPRQMKAPEQVSVEFWESYLAHKLTRYDMQQSKREASRRGGWVNPYRLGHLLGAGNKIRQAMKAKLHSTEEADMEEFRRLMKRHFDPKFPPIKAVDKAMDKYLLTGKRPKFGK